MSPEEKLKELGVELPVAPKPLGSYVPCVQAGQLVFLSGMLPMRNGNLEKTGRVGENITIDEAREDARRTVINALAALRAHIGSLDKVKQCIKIVGYIASASDFTEQPAVLNAASDFLREVFGEAGRHSRVAIGVNVLPLHSPLEIEFIFEVS